MSNLAKIESDFLLDLAHGKYDREVGQLSAILGTVSPIAKRVFDSFILLNRMTAPNHVVPDGAGGFSPSTNSRYDPKTGIFID